MRLKIVKGVDQDVLLSKNINATYVCPRKNEVVVVNGLRYFVRDVVHTYGFEDTLKIFVEEE